MSLLLAEGAVEEFPSIEVLESDSRAASSLYTAATVTQEGTVPQPSGFGLAQYHRQLDLAFLLLDEPHLPAVWLEASQ